MSLKAVPDNGISLCHVVPISYFKLSINLIMITAADLYVIGLFKPEGHSR